MLVSALTAKFSVSFDEIGAVAARCSRELKGNGFKFGQNADSRVQMFCLPFTVWERQGRLSLSVFLLVGRGLFVCFDAIRPF